MSTISSGNTTTTAFVVTGNTTGNLVFTTGGANTTALTLSNTQAATFSSNVTVSGNASVTGNTTFSSQVAVPAAGIKFSDNTTQTTAPVSKVIQVVQVVNTTTYSSSSTSYVTPTGMTASITPTSATSKILVIARVCSSGSISGVITLFSQLIRNATALDGSYPSTNSGGSASFINERFINYLDSPNTTSSTSYSIQIKGDGATWYANRSGIPNNDCLSTITLMEIAA